MPREGHGSRNFLAVGHMPNSIVMPREGHGSRNDQFLTAAGRNDHVMPREGHGSRNFSGAAPAAFRKVMPREGHGSRNYQVFQPWLIIIPSCPARGMGVEITI